MKRDEGRKGGAPERGPGRHGARGPSGFTGTVCSCLLGEASRPEPTERPVWDPGVSWHVGQTQMNDLSQTGNVMAAAHSLTFPSRPRGQAEPARWLRRRPPPPAPDAQVRHPPSALVAAWAGQRPAARSFRPPSRRASWQ